MLSTYKTLHTHFSFVTSITCFAAVRSIRHISCRFHHFGLKGYVAFAASGIKDFTGGHSGWADLLFSCLLSCTILIQMVWLWGTFREQVKHMRVKGSVRVRYQENDHFFL